MNPLSLNRRAILVGAGFLTFLIVVAGLLSWSVYVRQSEDPVTTSLARWFNLPAARVGSRSVSYDDYLAHLGSLRTYLTGPAAAAQGLSGDIGSAEKQSALDRAIRIAAIDGMAASADFIVTDLDVERAYDGLIARAGTSTTPGEIQDFLRDQFGWSEKHFKQYVIRPALLEDALRAKSLRDTSDPTAFDRELEERLKMADVVKYLRF